MVVHPEFLDHPLEEVLEAIWCRRELGDPTLAGVLSESTEKETPEILAQLATLGLIGMDGDQVEFRPDGEARAEGVVRRHRLSERLLSDVLDVPLAETEHQACLLEHILSPAVTDKVCAFLGHPPTCPHGLAIPSGDCCRNKDKAPVEPVVTSLARVNPGRPVRIAFIAPSVLKRLDKLGNYGVVPGTVVTLKQKRPSYVIEVGGTTLALEEEVVREIFVRREG
jgi:DtxR family transcriptional regulator, Mn-dependent transcriptional regulator